MIRENIILVFPPICHEYTEQKLKYLAAEKPDM